jgi:hypothetical protein
MEEQRRTPSRPINVADGRYLLVVGGLMVLIVLLLAGLWLIERRTTRDLADRLRALRQDVGRRGQVEDMLRQMLRGGRPPETRPLERDDLPVETVTWNGRPRAVFRISAADGRRIGLRPGDAVVVATQPATGPASRDAAGAPARKAQPRP